MKYGKLLLPVLVPAVAGAEGVRGRGIAAEGGLDALGDSLIQPRNRIQVEVKSTVDEQAGQTISSKLLALTNIGRPEILKWAQP